VKSWFAGTASSVNSEIITPFSNAEQIIYKYNQAITHNSLTQQGWQRLIAQCDDGLASYLTNIKDSTASMSAYSVSLQGNITGYTKITQAMKQYNALGAISQKEQQNFATAVSLTNTKLGSYLTGLNGAKASLSGYGVSLIASTAKTVGLTIATTALNAALTFGISAIITGVVSAFATWINSSKKITEAAEEAKDKISSINDDLKTNTETVENAKQRYAELAQEVENLGKVNQSRGSLSTDEYKEFLDLSNQLAGVFPQLSKNYDENGNAILDLSGSVDTIVGSLDNLLQKEKDLANQKIMDEFPDVYKGYVKDLNKAESEVKSAKSEFDKINNAYRQLQNSGGAAQAFDLQGNGTFETADGEQVKVTLAEYEQALKDLGIEYEKTNIMVKNQFCGDTLSGYLINATGDIDTAFTNKLETAKKNLDYAKQQLEGETSSISSYLNTWLQTEFTYNQIDDAGLQTAVQDMIMNFDFSNLPENVDKDNWNEVSEYLRRNILFAINDVQDDPDISKAISEVFTNQDLTPDEKADYLKQIKDYFDNELGKDNAISISLQPQIDDTDALQKSYENTINRFKDSDKIKDFFDTEGINTDDEINEFNEVTKGINDADKAIQTWNEHKKEANETPISFTETLAKVQLLSEGLDQLEKIYQDVLDEEDFDWSNILNNDKFTETFGNMENVTREYKNAYTDFIKTVSNSPNNIKGCQEAFNKLATAYINDSDALKNVTEETRDSVVNMLKDMNIVNADELVDSRLAERTLEAKTATVDFVNATKDELSSLIDYANQLGLTSAEVAQLCLDQIDVTNNPIDASASLKNLQTLILKAGVTGEKLGYLLKMVRAINTVTLAVQDGTATDSQITAAERLVDTLKSKMAEVSTANIEAEVDYKPKAKETKSKSDSEKDFDWIERKIKALESQISSLDKIIDSAYSSTTEKNNALIKQIDLINQEIELQQKAYEGYMAKANAVTLSDNYKKLVQNGSIDIETITDKDLQEAISNYQSYYDSAQECLDKINELHENALDKHVECHDNELSDLKDMLDNQSITEKQYIDEMYRLWEKYYDGQVELAEKAKQQKLEILNEEKSWLESVGNAAIALLDDQVDKLEDQKDKATKIYQDQIDVLNAQKKPLEYELELMERQKDAADKQLQYQKALYALRRAEQQRQNYTYTSDKGFIYKADDQTIKDAKKDVSDAEYELLKLNIQQQIDAIDDQIDHLNDLIDQTEKYYDTQIDGLNAYKEEWQKAIDMEELATNMQTFIDKFGADGLQRLFNEDMSLITNWKQSYLDNMAEIDMESTGTIGNLTKKFQELSGLAISPTITAMTDFEQAGTEAANAIANSLAGEEGSLSTAISEVNSKINGGGGSDNKEQSANGEQGQGGQTQDSGSDNLVGAMGELSDTALNEDTGIPAQTQAWTDMLDPLQEVSDKLNDIELTLENLNGKTFSINVEFKSGGASGSANANGNFTGAVIRSGAAFASGTLGASKDETALLGELGNELVVRGNRFFTVGNNGAEMFNVKKGDIIFNHQQTKDLLDKGCAMGHGVAYAEGNAGRVTMTAGIRPFRPGDPTYDMMQQFKTCYSNNVDALNLNTNALNQRHEDFMRQVQNISNSVVNRQKTVTQTINVSLPNINDSSTAQDIMRDLSQISQRAIQRQWR
jgi:hypothetical protein